VKNRPKVERQKFTDEGSVGEHWFWIETPTYDTSVKRDAVPLLSDTLCECGHASSIHNDIKGECRTPDCRCLKFRLPADVPPGPKVKETE
jgi:hypothetical protein